MMERASQALLEIGRHLQASGYRFITPTPATQLRVEQRRKQAGRLQARDLRDVFGWNCPFAPELLPRSLLAALERAGALEPLGPLMRAQVRYSTLGDRLFVHSGYPTDQADAVFFGPDTYRFCALVQRWAPAARRLVDVGCGSGAGGICADRAERITLADIGSRALEFARINLALNGRSAELVHSDLLRSVEGAVDLVIANPPYLRDRAARLYRDGGGQHGEGLGVRIVAEALERLQREGTLIVYTGSAIVAGQDTFFEAIEPLLRRPGLRVRYEMIDPDVFGEELEQPAYAEVERIAVVALRVELG